MTTQLALLEVESFSTTAPPAALVADAGWVDEVARGPETDPNEFRVDEHTREVGRAGIAAARRALAEAARRSVAREQAAAGLAPLVGGRVAA
jgi:hypothetical protein